ncbi:succinate dehydrogenase/fumarate reductase iron-sulfur subunit [Methylacidimicrobium tartarophylax]|uniref:Succinate dehydrogenase / fumarate reductase, iron-sulfur subunit n=1 Tax=Methylacidimicrobium tartarophylax TaxID=1041768 RepID=A0A5E6M6D4_9BACT|nr:succinate dehydrogenase/fumarate reductase iron-sulfur subunit [Methylacidimicrobium tartarophylax]VVM05114.1 succinate dehydrogenase / fumarate reductase, iron-sulfur subunit [Methylacidimicrobium tartarophylax]
MRITLRLWRQSSPAEQGGFVEYVREEVRPDLSFLEMLDELNQDLERAGREPVAFEHDCREGICGSCSLMINGRPHGPGAGTTTCQLYMRSFADGERITVEPFRSRAFPLIKDLVVDRSAFDRILQSGGYISVGTGQAPEANTVPVPHSVAEEAFDAAHCIGCGACVATCINSSAVLFVGAKVGHLGLLPQGKIEQDLRVLRMVRAMDREGYGACSFTRACEAVCPKNISVEVISVLNRAYWRARAKEFLGWIKPVR